MIKINKVNLSTFTFPGGEVNVSVRDILIEQHYSHVKIKALLKSSDDIMRLILTVNAIRNMHPLCEISLELPYFPYGRQDKIFKGGEALGVKVIADLINGLNLSRVIVFDPHSDITPALLNNCDVINLYTLMYNHMGSNIFYSFDVFFAPDTGAVKRVFNVMKQLPSYLYKKTELGLALKQRNPENGSITELSSSSDVKDKKVLVIDDICDGGATFIALGKLLKEKGCAKASLYVTHGIFSKGLDALLEYYEDIYCITLFDSSLLSHPRLHVAKELGYYDH